MQSSLLRLGSSLSLFAAFATQLGACSSGDAPCTPGVDCGVAGQGSSVAGGGSGAGGGGVLAGAGHAGTVSSTSAGAAGASSAGGMATAGSSGVAGSVSSGGLSGVAGGGSGAGGAGMGGRGGGGASSGGSGGSGGSAVVQDPITVGQCKDDYWPAATNGSVTRYDFAQGTSLPACAYVITHKGRGADGDWDTVEGIATGDGGYFGAMNTTDYAQGATCGACVEATYNGRKVVLTIVDECPVSSNPVCTKGHIDLSRKAIRQLEPNASQENLKNVSWHYVKCPAMGNVKTRLHPNQTPDWQPVVIENGLYPLKSVTLNGVNATRSGNNSGGNAWIASGQKVPYAVKATDVNGNAIAFSYSGGTDLKDVGLQFKCQ